MSNLPSSFDDEIVAFVLEELEDMGGVWLTSGLEGVLMAESGEIQHSGVTQEMTDGSAASALATCDLIAAAFGHGPSHLPDEIAEVVEAYGDEMRETKGLPDLAARVMAIVGDPEHSKYGGAKGINATVEEFQTVAKDVAARIAKVADAHPDTWDYTPLGEGTFKVNWSDAS